MTLAWHLHRRGLRIAIVDRERAATSSRIAAGLITPVTGKRLAKSWRWEELFPFAVAFYRRLEAETGQPFFHERPAVRLFRSEAERDEFHRRQAGILLGMTRAVSDVDTESLSAPLGGFEMHAARLDVPRYLDASREYFRRHAGYVVADVDTAHDVELTAGGVRLPRMGMEACGLVLCRGFDGGADPWFGGIRFNAAKGEILTVRIPDLREPRVLHRGVWLAAVGDGVYRCGATYCWEPLDCEPTAAGRAEIESRLREFLRVPFEVTDHHAAVRPVIDAGFPVLGRHPAHPQLAYFNGLGSKGSLLAPFFADQLAAVLVGEREPDAEVAVRKHLKA